MVGVAVGRVPLPSTSVQLPLKAVATLYSVPSGLSLSVGNAPTRSTGTRSTGSSSTELLSDEEVRGQPSPCFAVPRRGLRLYPGYPGTSDGAGDDRQRADGRNNDQQACVDSSRWTGSPALHGVHTGQFAGHCVYFFPTTDLSNTNPRMR